WRAVRAGQQRAALILREPPSSFGGWIVPRAGANGRGGELGIIEGFMGAVPEPDIANYNWIAGHDLAFVGRAIADHPREPAREANRPDRDNHRAGQHQCFDVS